MIKEVFFLCLNYHILNLLAFQSSHIGDTTSPSLQSFTMDMNLGMIILTFDEDIGPSSANLTGITIQTVSNITHAASTSYVRLQSGQSQAPRATIVNNIVTIQMYRSEIDIIKITEQLAKEASNTFLSMDQTTFTDRAIPPNPVQRISNEDALMVLIYIPDNTPPVLTSFVLNLEDDTMNLTFSEPVYHNLTPGNILISSHQFRSPNEVTLQLTYFNILTTNLFRSLQYELADMDAFFLESTTDIASGHNNTYLTALMEFIFDTSNNTAAAFSGVQTNVFVPDDLPPSLIDFDYDLNSAVLILEFNDIIDVSTLNVSAITLQSAETCGPMESLVTLADNGATTNSTSGRVITVLLGEEHTNEIKQINNLCTSSQNCYLSVTQFLVLDPSGVSNIPIDYGSAIVVRNFAEDITPPYLVFWILDMNAGIIELHFSETVSVTMLQYDQFTLQGSRSITVTSSYSLTSCMSVLLGPAPRVVFQLSNNDLNNIKTISDIGNSPLDSFLSIGNSAVVDMNGNRVVPIPSSDALQVASLIADATAPELVSFSLDIGLGVLAMTFSEIVDAASFHITGVSFTNNDTSDPLIYTLTGGILSVLDGTVIVIQLIQVDLGNINVINNLATSVNNTYILIFPDTVTDTMGNGNVPISFPFQASKVCHNCTNDGKIIHVLNRY